MLSSVLNSRTAIEINRGIMRAFATMRKILAASPSNEIVKLQSKIKELQDYMEEVFSDQNDINEDTRAQLELINQTLAELQAQKRQQDKPRNPVGFIKPKE